MPGYYLSGTTCVIAGEAVALTLAPSGTIASDTITFSDGGHGGTFGPSSLTFTSAAAGQVFSYSNATPGTYTLTLTSSGSNPIVGSPFTLIVKAKPTDMGFKRRHRWFDGLRR